MNRYEPEGNEMTDEYTCAVWYMRYFNAYYELCDTEEEAARYAVFLRDDGGGSVMGVQFADGRTIPRSEWALMDEVEEQMHAEEAAQAAQQPPARPVRTVRDPFQGEPVAVEVDEPAWLGRT